MVTKYVIEKIIIRELSHIYKYKRKLDLMWIKNIIFRNITF
jgi:hypothetical protein